MSKDSSKSKKAESPRLTNKKARLNFEILERIEAGIALKGTEVKALRAGDASIAEAYARIDAGQVMLINFQIQPYKQGNQFNHDPKRPKRLLLHKREIKKLLARVTIKGQTLIPLSVYFNNRGLAKVELALARGKVNRDKRQDERKKQDLKDIARATRRGGL
ncbi:MAG: SsrA-binding protein [Phycisphaerae bacterium]|nr:MAG: SsrA-binding protein SmpB [Planctomycetia bacterium]RIK71693.1 MAG: SsrA-binding protein [Planctomycetota bacterium]GJQ25383.1 MAG: SsrA-binding protein [Phycisphaerae bacterium]